MATKNAIGSNKPIEIPFGGLGVSSVSANGVIQGNGVSPVTTINSSINGQTLIGATSSASLFNGITAGANISVSTGSNTITVGYTGTGGGGTVTSWTPVLDTSSASWITFPTYTTQTGLYIQFGKLVIFTGLLSLSSTGTWISSSPPNAAVTGLPFTENGAIVIGEFAGNIDLYNTGSIPSPTTYIQNNGSIPSTPRFANQAYVVMSYLTNTSQFNLAGFVITQ